MPPTRTPTHDEVDVIRRKLKRAVEGLEVARGTCEKGWTDASVYLNAVVVVRDLRKTLTQSELRRRNGMPRDRKKK